MADLDKKYAEFKKRKGEDIPKAETVKKPSFVERLRAKAEQRKEHKEKLKALKDKIKSIDTPDVKTGSKIKDWKKSRKIKELESKVKKAGGKELSKDEIKETKEIRKTIKKQQKQKHKPTAAEKRRRFRSYLEMAGWEHVAPHQLARRFFNTTIAVLALVTIYAIYFFATAEKAYAISFIFTIIGALWTLGIMIILLLVWMVFYLVLDLMMFRRKLAVEEVLPDFLQLASANIRAGMPIDQALWYSVRPRFGVLAKEIEMVAKETLSGTDLNTALNVFAGKYDSNILKRSISLLIEGIEAGGEIGNLLNKISLNIQETRIMKKEMAASVMTYVIFISFATALAAPALFALSYQLLTIIKDITGKLAASNVGSSGGLSFSISGDAVSLADFQIFAIASLTVTSFFSAAIIATIRKGNIKEGISFIPIFIIATLTVYFIARALLGSMLGGLI